MEAITLTETRLSIYFDRSNAELSHIPGLKRAIFEDHEITIPEDERVFYFNRIKAIPEGQGIGTRLMTTLTPMLDQHRIWVYCPINPYGRLNLYDLRDWYARHGFEDTNEISIMIRKPAPCP